MFKGSFLKTNVIYDVSFSLSLFSIILNTSQFCPIMSFWFEVARLKYAKEDDI